METSTGHVLPGLGFFLVGLWHMLNQIKLHATQQPKAFFSPLWFPCPKIKYLELYLIILSSLAFISTEVLIRPQIHVDRKGTVPFYELRKFEHSTIAMTFIMHAIFSVILDKANPPAKYGMSQLIGVVIFVEELLIFGMHSTDHMGIEGQYHFFLTLIILVSLFTVLLGFPFPSSFINSFVRSWSLMFQGIWLVVIGMMLWTRDFIPKGCFSTEEHNHHVVKCHGDEATMRAKSLVNIIFSWCVIGFTIFVVTVYLVLVKFYSSEKIAAYESLATKIKDENHEELFHNVESQKCSVEMGKLCASTLDIKL